MELIPERPAHLASARASTPLREAELALQELLLGERSDFELPSATELASALTALARGARPKVLLPLARTPAEFALVRRGDRVLVSCYGTGNPIEVHQLDRTVGLSDLLERSARAAVASADAERDPTARQIALRVAEKARETELADDPMADARSMTRRGGAFEHPDDEVPLAFGFEASIFPSVPGAAGRSAVADVHALLFEGTLWAYVRGRRITLSRGPIMLAIQRMVVAVRALLDAWEAGRPTNVRLRAGSFQVGVRLDASRAIALSLGAEGEGVVTAAALDLREAALPILRLASDLLRALVAVDRAQSRNVRVTSMRDEIKALRKQACRDARRESFVNDDPDRLRYVDRHERAEAPPAAQVGTGSLRFGERWRIAVEGLDALATFMCGERIVLATPKHTLAVARDSGEVLWVRGGGATASLMAGSTLLRLFSDGEVELCDLEDGEPYASARVAPRAGGAPVGLHAGGGSTPPVAVLTEGTHCLVAIDLRTGEPRWRFTSRSGGRFHLRRAGRILLVGSEEGSVHALDVATGEELWRYAHEGRQPFAPVVWRDTVVTVASIAGASGSEVVGLDLYSGAPCWEMRGSGKPFAAPIAAGSVVIVACGGPEGGRLLGVDPTHGEVRWSEADPGLGTGGAAMAVDDLLLTNAPGGRVTGLDVHSGELRWETCLADPVADEVPRRLEPVLRGGALFVPAASVHVLRPSDGAQLTTSLPCDLVPDLVRVDERGWVYVAEESGYMAGYAPVPHLTLIRGGA